MPSRRARSPSPSTPTAPSAATPPGNAVSFRVWWLLSWLLLLGSAPGSLNESQRIIPLPENAVLAPDSAWTVPLARMPGIDAFVEWPHWLFAAVGAAVIASATCRLASAMSIWLAGLALVGWSLGMRAGDLVPALAVLGMVCLIDRSQAPSEEPEEGSARGTGVAPLQRKSGAQRAGIVRSEGLKRWSLATAAMTAALLACVVVTVEFGFLFLFVATLLLPLVVTGRNERESNDRRRILLLLPVVAVAGAGGFFAGFFPAMLRPISALGIRADGDLLPALGNVFQTGSLVGGQWLLVALVVAAFCRRGYSVSRCLAPHRAGFQPPEPASHEVKPLTKNPSTFSLHHGGFREILPLLVLSFVGLGCTYYFWLCTLAIAVIAEPVPRFPEPLRGLRIALAGLLLLAGGRLAIEMPHLSENLSNAAARAERVDPTAWGTAGPVLLMDLDQVSDWQRAELHRMFPLLVDDRWDIFGGFYPTYAAVCRDLSAARSDIYFRTDGERGGYKRWLKKWSPTLLVADSADTRRIRSLSLNPDWSLMSIDGRRTIFGRSDMRRNFAQIRRANETIMQWEWPGRVPPTADGTVIAAATGDERRQVADVLLSMRLPYAALRMLPRTRAGAAAELETWCYAEIAHRVQRYAGQVSLLDQYRAVRRFREGRKNSVWSPEQSLQIAYSLEGLGLYQRSEQFAQDVIDHRRWFAASSDLRRQAQALQRRCRDQQQASQPVGPGHSSAEMQVRHALALGEKSASSDAWNELEHAVRDYYGVFFSAADRPAEELAADLIEVLNSSTFPDRLRGEALFFLGGLAIELGDSAGAIQVLSESSAVDPHSPYRPLRQMYLQRLSSHSVP